MSEHAAAVADGGTGLVTIRIVDVPIADVPIAAGAPPTPWSDWKP